MPGTGHPHFNHPRLPEGWRVPISEYTVQDHLESIFTKTGTAREMCAELFTRFYRPHYDEGVGPGPYGYFLVD